MKQSLQKAIHYTFGEDWEFEQSYRILHPRHTYHTLFILLLAFFVAIILLWVPFPQSLSLVALLAVVICYFTFSEQFYWLLPIAILAPPLSLIKDLTVHHIIIPGMFFCVIMVSMVKKNKPLFRYIPVLIYTYFLVGFFHYFKNPSLPGHIFDSDAPYGTFRMYVGFFSQFMIYAIVPYYFSEKAKQTSFIRFLFVLSFVIIILYTLLILTRSDILTFIPQNSQWDFFYLQSPGKFPIRAEPLRVFGLLLLQTVLVFGQTSKRRTCRVLLILFGIFSVLLSAARVALIAMCVSFLLFFILTRKYRELVVSTLTGIGIVGILLISPHLRSRVPSQFQRFLVILPVQSRMIEFGEEPAASSLWRLQLWQLGWDNVKDRFFIGTGYQAVTKHEAGDIPINESESIHKIALKTGGLHNAYLSVLTIFGALGLLLFVAILISHTYKAFRIFKHANDPFIKQLNLWLLIVVASTMVRFWFEGGTRLLWLFFVLGLINTSFKLSRVKVG